MSVHFDHNLGRRRLARLESLGLWVQGASPGRRRSTRRRGCRAGRREQPTKRCHISLVAVNVQDQAEDLLTYLFCRCYGTI